MRVFSFIGYATVPDEAVRDVPETHLQVLTREVEQLHAGAEQDR